MVYKYKAKIEMHMHSNCSDGLFSVEEILEECRRRGFQFVSITDHNEIAGTLDAVDKAGKYGIVAFPGIELFFLIDGKVDELLVYFEEKNEMKKFYTEYMQAGRFLPHFKKIEDLVSIVRQNRGIICAPHPYCAKGICTNHLTIDIDEIEVANGMEPTSRNRMAAKYRTKKHLIGLANSDMHFYKKSLAVYTLLKSNQPITIDGIFANLRKETKTIKFIAEQHFKLTAFRRIAQWTYECFAVPKYLIRQFIWRKLLGQVDE